MHPQQSRSSADTPREKRSLLAREIALTLLVKLILIIAIKMVFFSQPADKREVEQRVRDIYSSAPLSPRGESAPSSHKEHP